MTHTKSKLKKKTRKEVEEYKGKWDKENIYNLIYLGLGETESKILEYLYIAKEAETHDFKFAFRFSPSKVNATIRKLRKRGWINTVKIRKKTDEHEVPIKIYSLKISFNEIIDALENEKKKEFDNKKSLSLDLSEGVRKTLAYLKTVNEAKSSDIEKNTGLCQSKVSVTIKELKSKDWIIERAEKKPSKGRPLKIYSLKFCYEQINDQIEKKAKKEYNEAQKAIEQLRKFKAVP